MEFAVKKRPQITVTVRPEVREALEARAEREHRSTSNLAGHLLTVALENFESGERAAA
jgi:hypothetical protein